MNTIFTLAISLNLLISNITIAKPTLENPNSIDEVAKIHVIPANHLPPTKAPTNRFTGDVTVSRLFPADDPLAISGGYVTFTAGARTNWHTHPDGQLLIITAGAGLVQQWGDKIIEVKQGDIVWFPPNVKHWHGAKSNQDMTHIALAKMIDGKSSDWLERVTDQQYQQN